MGPRARGLHALARCLGPLALPTLRGLARFVGFWLLASNSRAARNTRTNVEKVFPHESADFRERLIRESLIQTATTAIEALAIWTWADDRLELCDIDTTGASLLEHRSKDKGAILLAPHSGNWEYLNFALSRIEPVTALYDRPKNPAMDQLIRDARTRTGNELAPNSVAGLRLLIRHLKEGRMIAVLPDQVPVEGAGVLAPFFGHQALTMTLVQRLTQKVECEVFVGVARRVRGGFRVTYERVELPHDDEERHARELNRIVESVAREALSQYQWEYKRYRIPGQPNEYK